jgi:peroxiredoxin
MIVKMWLAALVMVVAGPRTQTPTVDDIVKRYLEATGGAAKWSALESYSVSSRSEIVSNDLVWKKPNRIRVDVWSDQTNDTESRAFDGAAGWVLSSIEGSLTPRRMSATEVRDLQETADGITELVDYKVKGSTLDFVGTSAIASQPVYQVRLTRASGFSVTLSFDTQSGLILQRARRLKTPWGEEIDQVLGVADYRAEGELILPHRIGPNTLTYRINQPVDESRFRLGGAAVMSSEQEFAALKVTQAAADLLTVGAVAPPWSLDDAAGRHHRLSDYRGKIVVMDFWAVWCAPCHKLMPGLQKLHDDFSARGVAVMGISTWEREGDPAHLMADRSYTYGLLLHGENVAEAYRVAGLPTVYVIDADGRILDAAVGADESTEMRRRAVIVRALGLIETGVRHVSPEMPQPFACPSESCPAGVRPER